ncbi:MAG: hypothetical protein WA871_09555 [Candidatus Acidiferrales bacterium]
MVLGDVCGSGVDDTVVGTLTQYLMNENRLASVTLPDSGETLTFKYDPFVRRAYKQWPSATSIFAYDGDNLIETVSCSGAVVARYAADAAYR